MRTFIYIIAWAPIALDPAEQALRFKHHILTADGADSAIAIGQDWAEREGILPLQGPGNDQAIELNALDDRDLQLAHDIANMCEMLRTAGSSSAIGEVAKTTLARMEKLAVNCLLNAYGLPLLPLPTSHPLPVFDGASRNFLPPAATEPETTEGHA